MKALASVLVIFGLVFFWISRKNKPEAFVDELEQESIEIVQDAEFAKGLQQVVNNDEKKSPTISKVPDADLKRTYSKMLSDLFNNLSQEQGEDPIEFVRLAKSAWDVSDPAFAEVISEFVELADSDTQQKIAMAIFLEYSADMPMETKKEFLLGVSRNRARDEESILFKKKLLETYLNDLESPAELTSEANHAIQSLLQEVNDPELSVTIKKKIQGEAIHESE